MKPHQLRSYRNWFKSSLKSQINLIYLHKLTHFLPHGVLGFWGQEKPEAQAEESAFADHENSQPLPNVIGNEGDEVSLQNETRKVASAFVGDENQQQQQEGDVVMYRDITGQTMRTRRTKSKTRLWVKLQLFLVSFI